MSVDLAASLASVVSRVAVNRSVDLSIEPAEVVFVENSDFVSLVFAVFWNIIIVARRAVIRVLKLLEDFAQSAFVSGRPFVVRNGVKDALEYV